MMIKYAKKMGIKSKLEANASLPLGTNELSILEFTNTYATLANTGYSVTEHLIRKIEDGNGDIIYEYKENLNYPAYQGEVPWQTVLYCGYR